MTWQRYAMAGAILSAPILAARHSAREGVDASGTRADSAVGTRGAPGPAAAGGDVAGTLTLLGAGADAAVGDAVVYLEPLGEPVEAPRPAPAPVAVAAAATPAPRDSVRLLWGAVRELNAVARDLRDRVSELRTGAPARAGAPPATPALATIDSAASRGAAHPAPTAVPRAPEPVEVVVRRSADPRGEIAMRQKTFLPHVRVVAAGGTVAYPNRDPFSHNVFSNTPGGSFDLGLYPRGESRGAAFQRAGVYAVFCNIHPRMSAYVVAVPSGYYARPGAGGRFVIADVPPGRYRVRAWHERAREPVAHVITVAGRGAPGVDLTLDARGYRPQPHANKYGQPYARTTTGDEY